MAEITEAIRIEGLSEVIAGFTKADRNLGREVREGLKDAAEFVQRDAENRAGQAIHHPGSGPDWSEMRLGMGRDIVYIVPRRRATRDPRLKRPEFGRLLLDDALRPAVDENRGRIVQEITDALENLNQNAGLLRGLRAIAS